MTTRPQPAMTETAAGHAPEDRVCVGAITGARGLRGEVRIKSFTGDPAAVAAYGPLTDEAGQRTFEVRVTAERKGQVIARLTGIDDRDGAEALKGMRLYVAKSALPAPDDGAYYHADLIGLRAETAAGRVLGAVKAVHNFGAGDIIEIAGGGGAKDTMMVPFTKAAVPEVDIGGGRLVVAPPTEVDAPPPHGDAGGVGDDEKQDRG